MPADIDSYKKLCKEKGLLLIEDAACAVGSSYKGAKIGSHSDLVCFPHQESITTGEEEWSLPLTKLIIID